MTAKHRWTPAAGALADGHASWLIAGSPARRELLDLRLSVAAVASGFALAVTAGFWPLHTAAATLAAALVAVVAWQPQWAAYLYLGLGPLIVGLGRGAVIPGARVNEALLALLWLGVVAGPVRRWLQRGAPRFRLSVVDWAVGGLAVFSSVTGLTWMYARGAEITVDDLVFALTLWKYLALYALFRITLRNQAQVWLAVRVLLGSLVLVAVLGVLQAVQVGPVPDLLSAYVAAEDQDKIGQNHAKSTIGASIPFADVMTVGAALAVSALVLRQGQRVVMALTAVLFAVAALASGQFSGVLGLLVVAIATGWSLRRLKLVLVSLLPLTAVAAVVLQPAIAARLDRLDPATGLPLQWTGPNGRLSNLETFFWPRLTEGLNWLLGVQTSARLPAPEQWREWIWIESGYTWLLWNGGVPLLLAFLIYVAVVARVSGRTIAGAGPSAFKVVAAAAFAGVLQLALLMVVDPHLTMRGAADVLFPLVAITVTGGHALWTVPPVASPVERGDAPRIEASPGSVQTADTHPTSYDSPAFRPQQLAPATPPPGSRS